MVRNGCTKVIYKGTFISKQTLFKIQQSNNLCTTIPGHFLAMYVFIFHKTEVLTVILRCLTGLNLDWVKSYGLRCSLRPNASSANSKKIAIDKQSFQTMSGHSFANYMFIFHKTEIQTVLLRCLRSLNLNWYKSYDKKPKNAKNTKDGNICFCTKLQKKNRNGNICVLCHKF